MMDNILEYKGYHAKVVYDADAKVLYGKVDNIRDLVSFECDDIKKVEKEFIKAVDDYLDMCDEVGKEPDKEYKGTFNVRIDPQLHKEAATCAYKADESLNQFVSEAIEEYVARKRTNDR